MLSILSVKGGNSVVSPEIEWKATSSKQGKRSSHKPPKHGIAQ